jgi:hypothetical protein
VGRQQDSGQADFYQVSEVAYGRTAESVNIHHRAPDQRQISARIMKICSSFRRPPAPILFSET